MNDLNQQLFDNFRKVSAILRRNAPMGPGPGPRPMANTQNRILTILNGKDGLTQKQLAYMLGIRPQSLGELVNKMENNGTVKKLPDEQDRRYFNLYLTDSGKQKAEMIHFDDEMQCPFDVLNDDEKQELIQLMNKVIDNNFDLQDGSPFDDGRPMPPLPPRPGFGSQGGPQFENVPYHRNSGFGPNDEPFKNVPHRGHRGFDSENEFDGGQDHHHGHGGRPHPKRRENQPEDLSFRTMRNDDEEEL